MVLWRWDAPGECWKAMPLPAKQGFPLGSQATFVPLKSGRCGLLAKGAVTINGISALPLRILGDRDEIMVAGETLHFSTEGPVEVVPFPGQSAEVRCGRCQGEMREGEAAVRCPGCGAWHHQMEALACWSYDGKCSACEQPTPGVAWQPEPLTTRKGEVHGDGELSVRPH